MKKDISIILPSIRPQNLIKFYSSLEKACQKHSFELIIASPYLIPNELLINPNIKFLHTYSTTTVAFQKACLIAQGEFVFNTSDDGLLLDNCLDEAYDFFQKNCSPIDRINMIYVEGVLNDETLEIINDDILKSTIENMSSRYWNAHFHDDLSCLAGIQSDWKLCIQFFMKLEYFKKLGGFDCQFEFNNHAIHDLSFRAQAGGSKVYNSEKPVYYGSHLPGTIKDHAPVHHAQINSDIHKFAKMYQEKDIAFKRIIIDYDNWKNQPDVWYRRFPNELSLAPKY